VSSESSCALRLARHSQMHGLDTSNVSSRVESSQVEFEPIFVIYTVPVVYSIIHVQMGVEITI